MSARPDAPRTAFVTGASSGLGTEFSRMLMGLGARVWGTSRDPSRLSEASGTAKGEGCFIPVRLDLADPEAAARAFASAWGQADGGFDVVVNNAGFGVFGAFDATEWGVWEAQLSAMVTGTFRLAHEAFGRMKGRGSGCLVNVSSLVTEFPIPYMSCYNASKAALSALSQSLMAESRGSAVRVIDLRPGDYRTGFNRAMKAAPGKDLERVWRRLEDNLRDGPEPGRAASDLRRAILSGRSGIVRTGGFFQARLAPAAARLAPSFLVRAASARYFGV